MHRLTVKATKQSELPLATKRERALLGTVRQCGNESLQSDFQIGAKGIL